MSPKSKTALLAMLLSAFALAPFARTQETADDRPAGYHVVDSIPLPGEGGWDYLGIDTPGRKLYISHGTQEIVVDLDTRKIVGSVADLKGTHGVAISNKSGHGFTSNGGDNSMTMFDLKTYQALKQISLPIKAPDGIIYDPATDRVFAFSHSQQGVAVDAKTGDVAGTIDLGGSAEYPIADGEGHVYNNLVDKSEEIEIDAKTLKVTNRWPLAPCTGPSGVDMDRKTRRLFIGCHGGGEGTPPGGVMAILNADTGKIITTVPIALGTDANRFDPGTKLAFSSQGDGTITVVHEDSPDKFTLLGNIRTENGTRTMEVDTKTHTLYTVTAKFGPAPPPDSNAPAAPQGRGPRRGPMIPGSFVLLVIDSK